MAAPRRQNAVGGELVQDDLQAREEAAPRPAGRAAGADAPQLRDAEQRDGDLFAVAVGDVGVGVQYGVLRWHVPVADPPREVAEEVA